MKFNEYRINDRVAVWTGDWEQELKARMSPMHKPEFGALGTRGTPKGLSVSPSADFAVIDRPERDIYTDSNNTPQTQLLARVQEAIDYIPWAILVITTNERWVVKALQTLKPMKPRQLPAGYGAPMGRVSFGRFSAEDMLTVEVFECPLVDGYDSGGAYWGERAAGHGLWCVRATDGTAERYVEASSEGDAIAQLW